MMKFISGAAQKITDATNNSISFYKKEVVFAAFIFFAASLGFALGYLANREYNHAPIIIEKCAAALPGE